MSLLFNTLSGFVIAFLPCSKHLNFVAAITIHSDFGAQENKICHCFHFFPICLPLSDWTGCHDLIFLMMSFKPAFSLSFLSFGKIPWRRKWQPTPIFLPEKSHGQRSLMDYSPWAHKELDRTEWLSTSTGTDNCEVPFPSVSLFTCTYFHLYCWCDQ